MTTITIDRALLEQALEALDNIPHPPWRDKELADAIRAELAKPVERVEPITLDQFRAIANRTATTYRHRSDPEKSSYAFVDGSSLDDFWRKVCEAIQPTSAWNDAPEVAALKAERDASMKDAERLDYLQKHARCDPKMDGNHVWWPTTFNQAQNLRGETLREAIDAAIAKAEGRKE